MKTIYTDADKGDLPINEAVAHITDDWIRGGEYCERTVTDMRDALATLSWAQWVRVEEWLPEKDGRILATWTFQDYTMVGEVYYVLAYKVWYQVNDDIELDVTHWMPLPPAPDAAQLPRQGVAVLKGE